MAVFLLVVSLTAILLAAELFTNAIEWFGKRLKIKEGAVGSVLAAVGTALPETLVAVVAIVKGGEHIEAGTGAVLGAPMMLATLAMFITGASVLSFAAAKRRAATINADYRVVGHDLRSFFLVYILAFVAGIVPSRGIKVAIAVVLLGVYAYYLHRTFTAEHASECGEGTAPLHFHRRAASPKMRMVLVQLGAGLALMIFGASEFVAKVTEVAKSVSVPTLVLSLIITPIATELPEKFNSITWIRNRKDTLALGNITGAMVFQSSILPAIGILFTPWTLDAKALASIVIAVAATFILWADMTLRKRLSPRSLLAAGGLYVLYPVFVFGILPHL
jgi:cation:H+ antiporter